jgi:hypothetical protein
MIDELKPYIILIPLVLKINIILLPKKLKLLGQ